MYLDRGFRDCKRFIIKKLLITFYDLEQIVKNNPNYKSRIIEWAQKESKSVEFKLLDIQNLRHHKEFIVQLLVDDEPLGKGYGSNKKKAEQNAAQKSCEMLNLD